MCKWLKLENLEKYPIETQLDIASTYYDSLTCELALDTWSFEDMSEMSDIIYGIMNISEETLGFYNPISRKLSECWTRTNDYLLKIAKREHEVFLKLLATL